jgi:hypothetical protein
MQECFGLLQEYYAGKCSYISSYKENERKEYYNVYNYDRINIR